MQRWRLTKKTSLAPLSFNIETEGPPRPCFSLAGVAAAAVAAQGTDAVSMARHLLLLIRLPPQQLLLLMPLRHMSLSDIFLTTDNVRRVQWIHHAALEKEELAEASTSSLWKKELTIVQALQALILAAQSTIFLTLDAKKEVVGATNDPPQGITTATSQT
mmetsp:Transcript_114947/g.228798  ORF Transcript_114947/g.228798 Transcript_114947/m.228798 type:complete len:160 (-) Transcript_114947:105-584(-)